MRKFGVVFYVTLFILVSLGVSGCGKKVAVESAGVEDLLKMLPEKATGVFVMNLNGITQLDLFKEQKEKAAAGQTDVENDFFKNYMEFIEKVGLEPEKDLKSMAAALFESPAMGMDTEGNFVAVVDLNYDKEKILAFIKEKNPNFETEAYQGQVIYTMATDKNRNVELVFLNDHVIALGRNENVKSVIDVVQKGGKNVTDNSRLKPFLEELQAGKLMAFVMDIPEKMKESQPEGAPFKMDLSRAEILHGFVDHADMAWSGEMKLISKDEESNKQIMNLLNGLKGMAVLAGPEVAELVSNINISASADNIRMTFKITDELLKNLQSKLKEKSSGMTPPAMTE